MPMLSIPELGIQTQVPDGIDQTKLESIADNMMLSKGGSGSIIPNIASFLTSTASQFASQALNKPPEIERPSINPLVAAGLGADKTLQYLQMQQQTNISEAELQQRERTRIAQETAMEKDRAASLGLEKLKIKNAQAQAEIEANKPQFEHAGNKIFRVGPNGELVEVAAGDQKPNNLQVIETAEGLMRTDPETQTLVPLLGPDGKPQKAYHPPRASGSAGSGGPFKTPSIRNFGDVPLAFNHQTGKWEKALSFSLIAELNDAQKYIDPAEQARLEAAIDGELGRDAEAAFYKLWSDASQGIRNEFFDADLFYAGAGVESVKNPFVREYIAKGRTAYRAAFAANKKKFFEEEATPKPGTQDQPSTPKADTGEVIVLNFD